MPHVLVEVSSVDATGNRIQPSALFITDLMQTIDQQIDLRIQTVARLPSLRIKSVLDRLIDPLRVTEIQQGLRCRRWCQGALLHRGLVGGHRLYRFTNQMTGNSSLTAL